MNDLSTDSSTMQIVSDHTIDECASGFVQSAIDADAWFKAYMSQKGASATVFYRKVEAICAKQGIEVPVKLSTLKNKAGKWRSLREIPQAKKLDGATRKKKSPHRANSVENSTPTQSSPSDDSLSATVQLLDADEFECAIVPDVQPDVDAYPARCSETAVPLDPNELLAADWHRVQSSDKPDSYKRFHELLCEAERILDTTHAHEWDGEDWYNSYITLRGFLSHCKGCSAEYRAAAEQRVQRAVTRAMEGADS